MPTKIKEHISKEDLSEFIWPSTLDEMIQIKATETLQHIIECEQLAMYSNCDDLTIKLDFCMGGPVLHKVNLRDEYHDQKKSMLQDGDRKDLANFAAELRNLAEEIEYDLNHNNLEEFT